MKPWATEGLTNKIFRRETANRQLFIRFSVIITENGENFENDMKILRFSYIRRVQSFKKTFNLIFFDIFRDF